jgi:DNA-binding NtrC family response regulator
MSTAPILVVDDNKNVLTALELLLSREFSELKLLRNPNLILSEVKKGYYRAVLLDMNLKAGRRSGNEGLYWLREIIKADPDISVVMITAFGDIELAVTALKEGAIDFVLKPWDNQKVLATMKTAVQLSESRREVHTLRKQKESLKTQLKGPRVNLIGKSKVMMELMEVVKKVAVTPAEVLITGENGTGKELIAREIHYLSPRSDELLVTVDMGAIHENLFESELFGHIKGAFTDAHSDREGKIAAAHKGTLFLDEIGNLSLPLQAKLLSVLQERTLTPIGSNKSIPVDIRLICATNRDLNDMVEKGEFRPDLLYRINTIQIEAPPLRERGPDILILTEHFLNNFTRKYNKPGLTINQSAQNVLRKYKWPGNVRELQHSIERAVILSQGKVITAEDFNFKYQIESPGLILEGSLEEIESRVIKHSIKKHKGNLSAVAAHLGISRQTLYNKIQKYEL